MPDPIPSPQIPADSGYGPEHASVGITEAEWASRGPKARDRIEQLLKERHKAQDEAARERGQREALEKRLAQIEGRLAAQPASDAQPKKEGWDQFSDDELIDYKARAMRWNQLASRSTGDDEEDKRNRAEADKIDWAKLAMIDRILAERAAKKHVEGLKGELSAREQAQLQNATFLQRMTQQYGAAVADPNSELRREAMEQFRALASERGVTEDPHNLLAEMALQRAHAKLIGDSVGRPLSALDRGRLAVEANVRRDTAPVSEIAALRERGTREDRMKAVDLEAKAFWNLNFPQ